MNFCTCPALPARHGFFTREGGVSEGLFASLNCGLSGADSMENVRENRARVAAALGVAPARLLGLKQVHGAGVITVTAPWETGAGPEADALVTATPGLALGIITADCAPVLFADRDRKIVGAAHAGWRGALAGVLEATLAAMRALGAGQVEAAIGPCIGQASYEVSATLRDPIIARDAADEKFFAPGRPGHFQFDLAGYCALRLGQAGAGVTRLELDTYALDQKFFSYRRKSLRGEPATGHQISVICS